MPFRADFNSDSCRAVPGSDARYRGRRANTEQTCDYFDRSAVLIVPLAMEPLPDGLVHVLLLFDAVAAVETGAGKFLGRAIECTGQPCHCGAVGWPARLGLVRPCPGIADGHCLSGGCGQLAQDGIGYAYAAEVGVGAQ